MGCQRAEKLVLCLSARTESCCEYIDSRKATELNPRKRLFLDIDEALRSDFRLSNVAAIRTQFVEILQQRIRGPNQEYRGEDEVDSGSTPRPEGSYRLPPLSFGGDSSSGQNSDQSVPRSLTPITERTDQTSRNTSTKTTKSNFLMSEGSRGGQRQSSGSSSKQMGLDDRLAPISDRSEFGPVTEEPASTQLPDGAGNNDVTMPTPTTNESNTADTSWSQDSAPVPGEEGAESSEAFHTPQARQDQTFNVAPVPDRDLPDLPTSGQSPEDAEKTPRQTSGSFSPGAAVALAAALPSPPQSRENTVLSPTPRKGSVDPAQNKSVQDEPAATYLMNMVENGPKQSQGPPQSTSVAQGQNPALGPGHTPIDPAAAATTSGTEDKVRPTIITSFDSHRPSSGDSLGRKPSGARALPPKKQPVSAVARPLEPTSEAAEAPMAQPSTGGLAPETATATPQNMPGAMPSLPSEGVQQRTQRLGSTNTIPDLGEDAASFMAFADQPSPNKLPPATLPTKPTSTSTATAVPVEHGVNATQDAPRSSFAPSQAALDRRAKADDAAAEQERAKRMPGAGKKAGGGGDWSGSEDEDETVDSPLAVTSQKPPAPQSTQDTTRSLPTTVPLTNLNPTPPPVTAKPPAPQRVASVTRALPAIPRPNGGPLSPLPLPPTQPMDRPSTRSPAASGGMAAPNPLPQPPQPAYSQTQPPPAARQTIWNANFSADHGLEPTRSGKFIDAEDPQEKLTKAISPHGLLQAGMQDKEDRSAKRQEEMARETGTSLVNIPSKPPPPQTGLLGALAEHEKDRKNAGGIGATITERENQKRIAVSLRRYFMIFPSFPRREGELISGARRIVNARSRSFRGSRWSTCDSLAVVTIWACTAEGASNILLTA